MGTTNNTTKNIILGCVIAALLGACCYLYYSKQQLEQKLHNTGEQLVASTTAKDALESDYNAALTRLDELTTRSKEMQNAINAKDGEVAKLKNEISAILSKKNATAEELSKAKNLIATLNTKVVSYETQINALKKDNATLNAQKENLTIANDALNKQKNEVSQQKEEVTAKNNELQKKVDLGKVLNASNITLLPIKKRWLTGAEASTTKAKRAELIRINFDLDGNRLAESGNKELYIVLYAPNGDAYRSGTFLLSNGTEHAYTTTRIVPFTQGQAAKNIALDWKPGDAKFETGNYNVEIYHAGYLIGSNVVALK